MVSKDIDLGIVPDDLREQTLKLLWNYPDSQTWIEFGQPTPIITALNNEAVHNVAGAAELLARWKKVFGISKETEGGVKIGRGKR